MKVQFYILFLLLFSFNLAAQTPLEKELNFKVKELSLEKALYQLIDQGEVNISFSNDILPSKKKINIRLKRKTVAEILDELLKDSNLKYILTADQQILLVEKPLQPKTKPLGKATISGYLLDADSGEPLIGAALQDLETGKGTFSNTYGFFSLTIPKGKREIQTSYLGYQIKRDTINLSNSFFRNFELNSAITLAEVIIYSSNTSPIIELDKLGKENFNIKDDRTATGVGGENDLIKKVHQVAGVQTGADGYGGFTVRGGNVDQNLVLLDGVPVYNSLHALGLYSIFNASTISSSEVLKGVFPARYGGRVSSVIDVRTKEGNNRKLSGELEFGPLSGNALIEGPIKKGKSSYLLSYRRSFIDLYSRPYYRRIRETENSSGELSYYFYDINGKINHQFSEKDKVYFNCYVGEDRFEDKFTVRTNSNRSEISEIDSISDISFSQQQNWGNIIASSRWNHTFSNKIFANTTFTYTRFFFQSKQPITQVNYEDGIRTDSLFSISRFNSNNRDIAAKIDFDYHPSSSHHLLFGANITSHQFQPYIIQTTGNIPLDTFNFYLSEKLDRGVLKSFEYEAYIEDEYKVNDRLNINPGLRFSIINSSEKTYFYPQPRFSLSYKAAKNFFLQAAAGYVVQPVHLLTTTGRGRAEDLWVPATSRFKPIESWQYVAGIEFNPGDFWTLSLEGYYKNTQNILSFQEGQIENINAENWQNNTVTGTSNSYGLEFLFHKKQGKTTAMISYTLAYSNRRFADKNNGLSYRSQFDRRHNLNIVLNHKIRKKIDLNLTFVAQSGALTSVPQASYFFGNPSLLIPFQGQISVYSGINNFSLPTYHRLDLGMNYNWVKNYYHTSETNQELQKLKRSIRHTLKFGIYNVYNQQNPSYYRVSSNCAEAGLCTKQVTLVPIMPFIRYRMKF